MPGTELRLMLSPGAPKGVAALASDLALRSGAGSALIDASKKIEWSDERWNARPTFFLEACLAPTLKAGQDWQGMAEVLVAVAIAG